MEPFLNTIPSDPAACEALKLKIASNRMASRFFSLEDFTIVSLILIKDSQYPDDLLIHDIQEVINNHPGPEEVLMGGLPFVRYSISENINHDLIILLPVALLLMVLMLYFSFRESVWSC